MNTIERVKERVTEIFPELVAVRRHLHRHPELSYQEFETTEYIISQLTDLGIEVARPLETGCVGIIKGGNPGEKVVALRADIDALPIREEGEYKSEFLSENEGVAHCCGHDVHTTNLLGAARLLAELRSEIEGTILLVFQPGEEKLPGGGRLLCETGFLQDQGVQAMYGLHTNPNYGPGEVICKEGPFMARPDEFEITLKGVGGHAAAPHEAVDPIVAGAQLVSAIQSIVSRNINPNEPAVVTVGKFDGGTAHNIIPEKVEMLGTIRTFSRETSLRIADRIEALTKGIAEGMGGSYQFTMNEGYPAVVNTEWCAEKIAEVGSSLKGNDHVLRLDQPIMAGEDFSFYQQHFPGAFFFLGSGSEQSGAVYPWHHPKYNADEECIKTGAAMLTLLGLADIPHKTEG